MTREMEQPATLPLRFPSSPIHLAHSALEWKGYNRSHLDRATIFKTRPTSSAVREPLTFSKPLISKRPKQQRRKVDTNRQQSKGNSLSSLVAGSSALLGALAVSLLTPGAFPESSPDRTKTTRKTKSPTGRCPINWRDATHVNLGCVWAAAKGGGVSSINISLTSFVFRFQRCS